VKFSGGRGASSVGLLLLAIMPAKAQDSAALLERLRQSATVTSLDLPDASPWHLKIEVQKFDGNGKPTEQGTVEEWWASPNLYRVVYTTPSSTATELRNAEGDFRSAENGDGQLELLRQQVVHPLPPEQEMNAGKLEQQTESFGKAKLDCVMVGEEIRGVAHFPYGLFPMYCMEPGAPTLRLTYNFGSVVVVRNKMGTFRGKQVPMEAGVNMNGKVVASEKITMLQAVALTASDFVPSDDLKAVGDNPARVGSGVMAGSKIYGLAPIYPATAKQNHVSGTVVMHALIGRDGRIHQLNLLSYPDGDLAMSALAAVRSWTYKPYMLNSEPTEVDTTITVNYNFGPY
jgi:TonB family protein